MEHSRKRTFTYMGLTALILVCIFATGSIAKGMALMAILVFVIVTVLFIRQQLSKGNIQQYDVAGFELVWKDAFFYLSRKKETREQYLKRQTRNLIIAGVLFVLMIPSWYLLFTFKDTVESLIGLFMGIVLIMALLILTGFLFIFLIIGAVSLVSPSPELHLYRQGIRFLNNFIEWEKLKSISYPASFRVATAGENIRRRGIPPILTITTRIMTQDDEAFLVELRDRTGFEQALKSIQKEHFLH